MAYHMHKRGTTRSRQHKSSTMTSTVFATTDYHYDDDVIIYDDICRIVGKVFDRWNILSECDRANAIEEIAAESWVKTERDVYRAAEAIADEIDG
jgi:hypothetical protein